MITDETPIIGFNVEVSPCTITLTNPYKNLEKTILVDEIQPQKISKVKRALLKPSVTPEYKADRNALCPCGSGKKFKKCCINKTINK